MTKSYRRDSHKFIKYIISNTQGNRSKTSSEAGTISPSSIESKHISTRIEGFALACASLLVVEAAMVMQQHQIVEQLGKDVGSIEGKLSVTTSLRQPLPSC